MRLSALQPGESPAELRTRVESEPLPRNYGAHLQSVAEAHGEALAWITIDGDGPNLTYRQLSAMACKAANAFRACGVRKGQHVGVMLPNGPDFLVAWLGLAKVGAVLVPVNPKLTPHELEHVVADGNVALVLAAADGLKPLKATSIGSTLVGEGRVIVSDVEGPRTKGEDDWRTMLNKASPDFVEEEEVSLDDPISILYTSGSTGRPKGCILTHRYWLTLGKVKASLLPPVKRILCELPFYYMSPYYRFSAASFQAAAICVPPAPSISKFYDRVARFDIDVVWIGDPIATLSLSDDEQKHKLKYVSLYGLKKELHRPLEEKLGVPVRESFGMTEVGAGLYMPADAEDMLGSGSCGIPAPFRECTVADDAGNPLPVGMTGELLIAGPGIFKGYYKNPEATAHAFWGKWFRTGDLARMDERGYFYIVGRIKEMIKRSSENIAAQEVESAIYTLPQVMEVAVIGVPDAKRGEEVKACIVLQNGLTTQDLPPDAIAQHCRTRLASFKVPRYIQYYSALPKTSSEKIAKKTLSEGGGETISNMFDLSLARD
ncbi:class I adenylate-forming enzyme family protein [Microvirga pudoricolor]|uniref:class I adenylate-forming enzyme family protein n=1 Tax=Microvirga pudoricolor TaxID=2778729 RepID=UPI00194E6224|nr:AMP-binding protein [Microvirga pudoricolor]MBM6593113.1 AMP-binding protein [Microvirga pudoricolor]